MIEIDQAAVDTVRAARQPSDLHSSLQTALLLEHYTIPLYLTALYSLVPGANQDAASDFYAAVINKIEELGADAFQSPSAPQVTTPSLQLATTFCVCYRQMLTALQQAFSGQPGMLGNAISLMRIKLKSAARSMVATPDPNDPSRRLTPSWEYLPDPLPSS